MIVGSINKVGCTICNNSNIADVVDKALIEASISPADLAEQLETENGIYLSVKEIEKHKKHLFVDLKTNIEKTDIIEQTYKTIVDSNNLELIDREIAELTFILKEMVTRKEETSVQFSNLLKIKQKYLELKLKLSGEDVLVVEHKIPEWIKLRGD